MTSIQFSCPQCHTRLSALREQVGTPATCPDCEWTFYVPKVEAESDATAVVKFFCPHCSRKLSATAGQFATEMPCPFEDCRKPVLVPSPDWKPLPIGPGDPRRLVAQAEAVTRAGGSGEG